MIKVKKKFDVKILKIKIVLWLKVRKKSTLRETSLSNGWVGIRFPNLSFYINVSIIL